MELEVYRVLECRQSVDEQGRRQVRLSVQMRRQPQRVPAGTIVVRTQQPLDAVLSDLLEPVGSDGLLHQDLLDPSAMVGQMFPVLRLCSRQPLLTATWSESHPARDSKPITYETLYGRERADFGGRPESDLRWLDDNVYLQRKTDRWYRVHADSGQATPLYDVAHLQAALQTQLSLDPATAERWAAGGWLQLDPTATRALFEHNQDLYAATLDGQTVRRLTDSQQIEELATFSPDGRLVAFVQDFDLYVADVQRGTCRRLTSGGSSTYRQGKADWVYFEEIYQRDWKAFQWSPDSQYLAFQVFDDESVAPYAVLDDAAPQQRVEQERYPRAGEPNPRVKLAVVPAAGGAVQWADLSSYSSDAMLITRFGWAPDSRHVYFYVQNRTQQWLDFRLWQLPDNSARVLYRETSPAWVDDPGAPRFLGDGSLVMASQRSGWNHLYRYSPDGQQVQPVTQGEWEVRRLHAIDPAEQWVYFAATRDSHIAENLYRARLDGSQLERITHESGEHRPIVSPGGLRFVDVYSSHATPPRVTLHNGAGESIRVLDTNPVPDIQKYDFRPVELTQIRARDGFLLEASLIKPPQFDPQRKYPVWLLTYGGPSMPSLSDAWSDGRGSEQMLAQMGLVVVRCDPRSASGKGVRSAWTAYRRLGVMELQDLEDAVDWLASQSFVDAQRIGLSGHSYGGFLTAYALTHSDRFAAGIAGAPVTDWRNYDTIYTERYMGTPQDNPDGYRLSSVVAAAAQLRGRLLLIHGAQDDNVHLSNCLQLVQALQAAGKSFELMIYPDSRHGIHGDHYHQLRADFIRRWLRDTEPLPSDAAQTQMSSG